jgi:hypothetical protein
VHGIPPELADRMIAAMGGATVIYLDAGHARTTRIRPNRLP